MFKNSLQDSFREFCHNNKYEINNKQLEFFASKEFTAFYRIARNFGTRSLNIDKNSVFFWGLKKAN